MKESVVIPSALILCIDDLGWHLGTDGRHAGQPSRTGMPRPHRPEDYAIVNEIGKAIDMRILCPICLAEWDKNNILRGEAGITYAPETWDRASKINYELTEKAFEIAENSEFIEYALHGNLHGNYAPDGRQITEMECFEYKNGSDLLTTQSEEEILHRFELFFKLYDTWGFKKKIRSYVAPNGIPSYLTKEDLLPLASALKKYGIKYWTSRWKKSVCHTEFFDGIIYMEKNKKYGVPWNAYDYDPAYLFDFMDEGDETVGDVMGMHWPNFLRYNYQNNGQCLEPWVKYFKRQSEIFGLMLAKDIAFSSSQHIYRRFSNITFGENRIRIDITDALAQPTDCLSGKLYISLKNDIVPEKAEGGNITLFETHEGFKTYEITHTSNVIDVFLKP